jgi:superfamily II DNA or RNA helicase
LINNPITIRSSTFRRNIGLQVYYQGRRRANQQTFIDYCVKKIHIGIDQVKRDKDARLLVICRFKKKAQALATCLKCECYYSNIGTITDKAAILARWLEDKYQIICGIKGLATELDHPSIRIVFFIEPSNDALELMQEMGRVRREGTKRSIC